MLKIFLYLVLAGLLNLSVAQAQDTGSNKTPKTDLAKNLISEFALHQNYPNPFRDQTSIDFDIPTPATIKLEILNTFRERVAVIFEGNINIGRHTITIKGEILPNSSVYFYQMSYQSGEDSGIIIKKMLFIQ